MRRLLVPIGLLALFMACGGDPAAPPPTTNPDLDGDGILNAVDQCPNQPETFNGALDSDGCPDITKDLYVLARQLIEEYWDVLVFTEVGEQPLRRVQDPPIHCPAVVRHRAGSRDLPLLPLLPAH